MDKEELAKAACEELGKQYARRLHERWKRSQPLYKYAEEVKKALANARQEVYFHASGVYEEADRTFISMRVAVLFRQAEIDHDARVFAGSGDPDIRLEFDKKHELKEPVHTFGDLLDKELVWVNEAQEVVVTRTLDDYLFEPIHD